MKLLGKTAIVTGGSGHIGRAIVEELVKEGADVVFTYLVGTQRAKILIAELKKYRRTVITEKCDVRKFEDVKKIVDLTANKFKKIDILVNCAGSGSQGPIENFTENDFSSYIDVDVKGALYFLKLVVPIMKKQHYGKIINIGSIVGTSGISGHSIHGVAKGGLIGLTKNLAIELAEYNIYVNCISPGTIEANFPKETYQKWIPLIPLKKIGQPKDVARPVVFLASSDSDFITGENLIVDGGHSVIVCY